MTIFFCVLPAIFLLIKNKKYSKKIAINGLLFMLPAVIVLEILAHSSNTWYETTIFPFRVFNLFPLESFLWGTGYYLLIVAGYEYFFDKKNKQKTNSQFKILLILTYLGLLGTLICIIFYPNLLAIPYFYTIFLVIILVLTIIAAIMSPTIFKKGALVSLIILIPSILHEYVSSKLGHWIFTQGHHLGYVNVLDITLPIEELIWLPLFPIWIVLFYEFFQDDFK
jgi:hypothetical protein